MSLNPEKTLVIIFGASEWPDYQDLNYCPDDSNCGNPYQNAANGMMDYFHDELKIGENNLLFLFDNRRQPGNLIKEIKSFLGRGQEDEVDHLFFYFVGHGDLTDGKYSLCTACAEKGNPASFFKIEDLVDTINSNQFVSRIKHCYFILDACYAGQALPYLEKIKKISTMFFPSCHRDKEAKIKGKMPMFTQALLESLRDKTSSTFFGICESVVELLKKQYGEEAILPEIKDINQGNGHASRREILPAHSSLSLPQKLDASQLVTKILFRRHQQVPFLQKILQGLSELNLHLKDMQQMAGQSVPEDFVKLIDGIVIGLEEQEVEARMKQLSHSVAIVTKRFSHPTINLGVAGTAGQGKSTLLQTIANLTDKEIPTSSNSPCTGTMSRIYHSEECCEAHIEFYTKQEFLTEIIHPYFDQLGLRKPLTLEKFAKSILKWPVCANQLSEKLPVAYGELEKIHGRFLTFSHWLSKPTKVAKLEELQNYVLQHDKDGQPLINYLAVKVANVYQRFSNHDAIGLCLVDLPGLEMAQGREKKLVTLLASEVDMVILAKFPNTTIDHWTKDDCKIAGLLNNATSEIDIDLASWLFIVLNKSSQWENQKLVSQLRLKQFDIDNSKLRVLKANFCDVDEVGQVCSKVLKQLEDTDSQYINLLADKMDCVLTVLQEVLKSASNSLIFTEDADGFLNLFDGFRNELCEGLRELVSEQRGMTFGDSFKLKVDEVCTLEAIINRLPGILPDSTELERQCKIKAGWLEVLPLHLGQLRTYLSRYLAENLDAYLKGTVDEVLVKALSLNRLLPVTMKNLITLDSRESNQVRDPRDTLRVLQERLDKNKQPNLYSAFEYIIGFNLSYQSLFQPRVRSAMDLLDSFEGDAIFQLTAGTTCDNIPQQAEEIARGLNHFYLNTLYKISKKLGEDLQAEIDTAIFTFVEEIQDRLAQTKEIEKEWRSFLYPLWGEVWPEQFKRLEEKAIFCKNWQAMIEKILATTAQVQVDFQMCIGTK